MKYVVPIIICLAFLALVACSRTSPIPVSTQAQYPTATVQPTATGQPAITPSPGLQTVEYLKRYSPNCGKTLPSSYPPGVTPVCPPTPRPTPQPTQPPLWDSIDEFIEAVPGYGGFFYEPDSNFRVAYVYMLDTLQQDEAEQAAVFFRLSTRSDIRAIQGEYSWGQLEVWLTEAQKGLWLIPEVHSSKISHRDNRIQFGVETEDGVQRARRALVPTGVPEEAVVFDVSPKRSDIPPRGFDDPTGLRISLEFQQTVPAGQPIPIQMVLSNGNNTRVEVSHPDLLREEVMIYTSDGDQITKKLRGVLVGAGGTTLLQSEEEVTLPIAWSGRNQNGTYLRPGRYLVRGSVRYSPDRTGVRGTYYVASDPYELTIGPRPTPTPGPLRTDRDCGSYTLDLPCGPGVEMGKAYSFIIYTHCGVRRAYFDGYWWLVDPMLSDGNGNPPSGWGNPYDRGMMEMVAVNVALYTSESGMLAVFTPLPEGEDDGFSCQ